MRIARNSIILQFGSNKPRVGSNELDLNWTLLWSGPNQGHMSNHCGAVDSGEHETNVRRQIKCDPHVCAHSLCVSTSCQALVKYSNAQNTHRHYQTVNSPNEHRPNVAASSPLQSATSSIFPAASAFPD